MRRLGKSLILVLSIASVCAVDKKGSFKVGPASSFASKQKVEEVIVASEAYETEQKTKTAFGKLNPNRYGVLPVLVVIENTSKRTISLEAMTVRYSSRGGNAIEPVPAQEVKYLQSPEKPKVRMNPIPGLGGPKKNPLAAWEIEGRTFAAKMLPPGESAHGFFYFRAEHRGAATLIVSRIQEAGSGRELFFFEIPLDAKP